MNMGKRDLIKWGLIIAGVYGVVREFPACQFGQDANCFRLGYVVVSVIAFAIAAYLHFRRPT